jgi:hypothetical protein
VLLLGCESKAVIAAWSCPQSSEASTIGVAGSTGAGGSSDAFPLPWSTGFENGWCDFNDGRGGFIETGAQVKDVVTEPVHSGSFAAAFTVNGNGEEGGQLRGIRRGQMPSAAYYGAWYLVPTLATNAGLWNLFHFQGDNNEIRGGHLWDISLVNNDDGDLRLNVFSYLFGPLPDQSKIPPIPIGSWFHIEMYWKRAKDDTGEVTVYQNGAVIFQFKNAITDNSNNSVQWYVGNLATNLVPSESTVYVDDVTIDTQR